MSATIVDCKDLHENSGKFSGTSGGFLSYSACQMMYMWLNFLIGMINSIGERLNIHDSGFKPSMDHLEPLHHSSLDCQPRTNMIDHN